MKCMTNNKFYQYALPQRFHISVGAVVFDDQYRVCLHHFEKKNVPEHLQFLGDYLDDIWHLVRESLEGNEPLHDAVLRGVQEELGATGTIEKYLGAKIDRIDGPSDVHPFEKVTLYHAVRLGGLGERPQIDTESKTLLEWYSPAEAIEIFTTQASKTSRPELDERVVIERFIDAYNL